MKKYLVKLLSKYQLKKHRERVKIFFNAYFTDIASKCNLDQQSYLDKEYSGWLKKWSVFAGDTPNPLIYKVYSQYIKHDKNRIVPNDIARNYIEPILTPFQFQPFYNDKNSFNLFIDKDDLPRTLFRSMNHHLLDENYNLIKDSNLRNYIGNLTKVVVKPTMDMGGRGVSLFKLKGDSFIDGEGNVLTREFLTQHYDTNFVVQECIEQSEYMSQFNPSSVNTIRIATYRDVYTGEISVIGAVMRMGGSDSFVDNACSGGVFISVSSNGELGHYVCDEFGRTKTIHNGIDFEKESFVIPNYDMVKQFVTRIANRLPHMSLLANDVAITKEGRPILIEVNTQMFSYWLYQMTGNTVFGDKTDSLIKYCVENYDRIIVENKLSCK